MNADPLTLHREACLRKQQARIQAELRQRGKLKPLAGVAQYTPDQVREIRRRYAAGEKPSLIVADVGGTYHGVYRAAVRITYKGVS